MASDPSPLRIAFFHTELSRDGPGLLLRDLTRGKDEQIAAVAEVVAQADADILVLQGVDWDYDGLAERALVDVLAQSKVPYPFRFTAQPNRGKPTGLDMDGNGRVGDPQDRQGYALFTGANGLIVLSRFPIGDVRDFSNLLWADAPGALLPYPGQPDGLEEAVRLSTTNHWLVPVETPGLPVTLGVFAATNPVFDGPEDRNGRRNHDEVAFWGYLVSGALPETERPKGFVLAGNANLDPERGDGRRGAIKRLLTHPALQDPAALRGRPTVDWARDDLPPMRVSYVLPSTDWDIVRSGMVTPDRIEAASKASRHRLIWVDIRPR